MGMNCRWNQILTCGLLGEDNTLEVQPHGVGRVRGLYIRKVFGIYGVVRTSDTQHSQSTNGEREIIQFRLIWSLLRVVLSGNPWIRIRGDYKVSGGSLSNTQLVQYVSRMRHFHLGGIFSLRGNGAVGSHPFIIVRNGIDSGNRLRPYHIEHISSRLITEVSSVESGQCLGGCPPRNSRWGRLQSLVEHF